MKKEKQLEREVKGEMRNAKENTGGSIKDVKGNDMITGLCHLNQCPRQQLLALPVEFDPHQHCGSSSFPVRCLPDHFHLQSVVVSFSAAMVYR